ncbi:MAG: hypothetical protein WCY92_10265, partial [Novosphingobium sp.]
MSLGKKMILGLGTSAMAMGWAAAAHGQEPGGGLNEIIVTAQKREQSLMDVGQTLSVLSGDALE